MPPSPKPNFCSTLQKDNCSSAPTALSQWCGLFHRPGFCSETQGQGFGRSCGSQLVLEPHLHPSQHAVVLLTDTAHPWKPGLALRNEMCLWGNLLDPVVCWVGRRFVVADGHLMSPKLSPFSSQANIEDLCGICSKVF